MIFSNDSSFFHYYAVVFVLTVLPNGICGSATHHSLISRLVLFFIFYLNVCLLLFYFFFGEKSMLRGI